MPKKKSSKQRAKPNDAQNESVAPNDDSADLERYIERRGFFWEPKAHAKTWKGAMTLLRQLAESSTLDNQLDRIEQEAKLILLHADTLAVEDAAQVVVRVRVLRQMVASGEHKDAVPQALQLGALAQRAKIRCVENSLVQGLSTTEGQRKSRKSRSENSAVRLKLAQKFIDELYRQQPEYWDFGPLCDKAAEELPHKPSAKYLRRRLRNPKKRPLK